jgi:hypothetical protein
VKVVSSALNRRLRRIRRFVDDSKDDTSYAALFSSTIGKKLGRQLRDLMNFVTAMNFMNMPITLFQREWIRIWKEGELEEVKKHSETTNGFEDIELMLRLMSTLSEQGEEVDLSKVFGRREMRRLLALLTLSSSAYLDSYLDSLADILKESSVHRGLIKDYIVNNKIVNRRDSIEVTEINHVWRLGSNQLVEILYEAINVGDRCKTHFTNTEIQRYRRLLTFFIRLRGKIAHGDPEPSLKRFDHNFFSEIKDVIKKSILNQWQEENIPTPLLNMSAIIQKWFKKNLSTMSVIFAVPLLIVLPLCMLDAVVDIFK